MPKNIASTRQVNPPGTEPRITAEQLWKGLELKIKRPELFVRPATGAEIVNEGGKTIRKMSTKMGIVIQEAITPYEGTMVYFDNVEVDQRVTNTISYDEANNLLLTFGFVGGIPGADELGANTSSEELNKITGNAVAETIDVVRRMVQEGSL